MLKYPLLIFAFAIISAIIGFGDIAPSIELFAKILFLVFMGLTLLAFIKEQNK